MSGAWLAHSGKLSFPRFIKCHRCGGKRRVIARELYELPEGVAGVVLAKCRRCDHVFVRFIGERRAAERAAELWLGLQRA